MQFQDAKHQAPLPLWNPSPDFVQVEQPHQDETDVLRARIEDLELRLLNNPPKGGSALRVRAHRDELIAMELELAESLQLASDGSLLSSPI